MKVCRVCLAMSVKMYHMPEHKLSDMYERVTGVKINSEDKLPKTICWECVARLSSANNFIEKALKTQWILLKKIKNITMSDIASIDRAQYQLESTLGLKYYEVNNTDLHIQRESDIVSDDHDDSNVELLIINYKDSEMKDVENFTIKSELLDKTEQPNETELQVPKPIIIKENLSDEEESLDNVSNASETSDDENPAVRDDREVCEALKQEPNDFGVTSLSNRNNDLLYKKELRVVLEDVLLYKKELRVVLEDVMLNLRNQNTQDSVKEITNSVSYSKAQSIKKKDTGIHPTVNKATLTNTNKMDTNSASTIGAAKCIYPGLGNGSSKNSNKMVSGITGTVNSYIDLTLCDAESSKKIFICDICNKSFQIKSNLQQHIQRHFHIFNCTYCRYKTNSKAFLTRHVNAKHTKNSALKCLYCSHKTYDRRNLKRHMNVKHTNNTVYNCSYCSFKAYRTSTLNNHVNSKHTKNTVYNCSYCSYKSYTKCNLATHINSQHTKNTVYNCPYCSYKTYSKSTLNTHVNATHTKNTVYNCSYCSFKAYRMSTLNTHVNFKHTKNTVYNCSYCSYTTCSKTIFNRHVNARHTKNIAYNCSYCSYKAYSHSAFNNHVNAKHTKNTVYNCSYCSYKAYSNSALHNHVNAKHTKNTAYNCSYCSFKANSISTLNNHVNSKHTKNTAYNRHDDSNQESPKYLSDIMK